MFCDLPSPGEAQRKRVRREGEEQGDEVRDPERASRTEWTLQSQASRRSPAQAGSSGNGGARK